MLSTETKTFRTLSLTEDEFGALYDAIEETIYQISDGLEGTDLTLNDYDLYHVWQQLNNPTPN
tara:strand:- start:463 stop:651 length:189 start_codon:yes stop_codon:yes gene_type:complete